MVWGAVGFTLHNLYDHKLDPRRVKIAAENVVPALQALEAGHARFVPAPAAIARELTSDDR